MRFFRRKRKPRQDVSPPPPTPGNTAIASGKGSVAVGGDATNSIFITGDHNIIADDIIQAEKRLKQQLPQLPPDVPRLHTLIGREEERETLLAYYERVRSTGRGMTAILTGKMGSGRHAIIQWLQAQVAARGGAVAATWFLTPRWFPADRQAEAIRLHWESQAMREHGQALQHLLSQAEKEAIALDPWLSLLAQLVEEGQSGQAIPRPTPEGPGLLRTLVRRLAAQRPLLLSIEYLEYADEIWLKEIQALAAEIAQEHPVLLILTLTTFAALRELPSDACTPAEKIAASMQEEGLAFEFYAERVKAQEIESALETTPELAQRLEYLAAGDPYIVESLFREWHQRGEIRRGADGRWQLSHPEREWMVYGELRDYAHRRLRALIEPQAQNPQEVAAIVEQAEAILKIGALEGESFTAEAVAKVLEMEAEEVRDLCERYLCPPEGADETLTTAYFLRRMGRSRLPHGMATRYRFTQPYLQAAFGSPALRSAQRWQEENLRLAQALQAMHYPLHGEIAETLYRLYRAAGAPREARKYLRRSPSLEERLTSLRTEVAALRQAPFSDDSFTTSRFFLLGFQLCDLLVLHFPQHWEEGYDLATALFARAEAVGDREFQAEARHYQAAHLWHGGRLKEALPLAIEAVERYEALDSIRAEQGGALNLLGAVLHDLGDLKGARNAIEHALTIFEQVCGLGHAHVASTLSNLGSVLHSLGDLKRAREAYKRALTILKRIYGPEHPNVAAALNNLGTVLHALGDLEGARKAHERALTIREHAYGQEHPNVAISLNNLGTILRDLGDLERARAALERVLIIREHIYGPKHPDVALSLNNLGGVLHDLGDLEGARAAFKRAIAILDQSQLPPEHPYIKAARANLASLPPEADSE